MLHTTTRRPRRGRAAAIGILILATGLLSGAVVLVASTRPTTTSPPADAATRAAPTSPAAAAAPPAELPRTDDSEQFARQVAIAIFAWDTQTDTGPVALVEPFVQIADPRGESTAGLVADVTAYLPSQAAWGELREYATKQWLTVTSVTVPTGWATAVDQAADDALLSGTTAYTVHAVRHRAGVWEGESVTSKHEVAFTIFMVCAPSYPECHLLRLSRLDDPLR